MTSFSREWLRAEAAQQGLPLTDADVEAIYERVAQIKAVLAARRPDATEDLEPTYAFVMREPGAAG